MENKYYTPTKQELIEHIINGETIYAEVYGTSNLLKLENSNSFTDFIDFLYARGDILEGKIYDLNETLFRIKYLDKVDIEEVLQTKQIKGNEWELNFQLIKDDFGDMYEFDYDIEERHLVVEFYRDSHTMEGRSDMFTMFSGKIKNKSEFKKLFNQLEIQ